MRHPIPSIGLALLLVSVFLHGGYVILLAQTYSLADLSQAYPIMRGTSPLLVPLAGVLILGEHLSLVAWMGVGSIVIGIFLVGGFRLRGVSSLSNRAVALAFGVGLMITGYTVFDKIVLQYIPPFALNEATNVGNLLALSAISLRLGSPMLEEWRRNWKTIILGGIMAPGGYIFFLKALQIMPVAQIAPMREIGTFFGTLLGVFVLREPQGRQRIGASLLIVLGVFLLSY